MGRRAIVQTYPAIPESVTTATFVVPCGGHDHHAITVTFDPTSPDLVVETPECRERAALALIAGQHGPHCREVAERIREAPRKIADAFWSWERSFISALPAQSQLSSAVWKHVGLGFLERRIRVLVLGAVVVVERGLKP